MKDEHAPPKPAGKILSLPALGKQDKRRAEDKFGVPVMKHGYTMLPNLLVRAQGKLKVGHAEFNVLVQLVHHWWDADKDPHPAKDTIARRMGLSPRQVQRHIASLETAGLVKRVERFSGRKAQMSNGYDLSPLVRKLGAIEPEFRKAAEQGKVRQRKVEGAAN
jgi:DNA-binding transcriptional ArsR family regulator